MLQGTVVHEAQKCGGMNTQAWHMQQQVNFFFFMWRCIKIHYCNSAPEYLWDKWTIEQCGESNHTNPTLFCSLHPRSLSFSVVQRERISKERQVWQIIDFFFQRAVNWTKAHILTVQINDYKTCNPDHVIQSYPAQSAHFPCQTTREWRRWGERDHWPSATPVSRRLYTTQAGFLIHATVIVIWLL